MRCLRGFVFAGCSVLAFAAVALPPVPDYCWDGDFNVAAKDAATLSLNGNALEKNGARVVLGPSSANGGKGVFVDWSARPKGGVSVLVKYAGYAAPSANWGCLGVCRGAFDGATQPDHPGVGISAGGATKGIWTDGVWNGSGQNTGTFAVGDGEGRYLFRYCPGSTAVSVYQKQDDAWTCVYACAGLKASAERQGTSANGILGFAAGGLDQAAYASVNPLTGLEILGIAVFDGELSVESADEYLFPSERGVGIARLAEGGSYKWSTLSWSGSKPTATADEMIIRVNGDAVLEMDESSLVALKCTVDGSGSLTLTGTGLLTGHHFVTSVPLKLQTPTGDLTLAAGLDTD